MLQEQRTEADEEFDTVDFGKELERVKWFLWHGNSWAAPTIWADASSPRTIRAGRPPRAYESADPSPLPTSRMRSWP